MKSSELFQGSPLEDVKLVECAPVAKFQGIKYEVQIPGSQLGNRKSVELTPPLHMGGRKSMHLIPKPQLGGIKSVMLTHGP